MVLCSCSSLQFEEELLTFWVDPTYITLCARALVYQSMFVHPSLYLQF